MDDKKLEVLLQDAFEGVRCDQNLKDKTLDNIMNGKAKKRQRIFADINPTFSPMMRGLAAAVCCVIAVVATFGVYSTPAAAICLDGDMSMRLLVNRFDRVLDVTAYNDNAKTALSQLKTKVKGSEGKQLLKDVMAVDAASDVEVYIISDNEKLSGAILADVATDSQVKTGSTGDTANIPNGIVCQVVPVKVDVAGNADDNKNMMTYQRYQLFMKIQDLGISLTEDQVRNMSIGDLRAIIAEAELGSGGAGHGSGTINGDFDGGHSEDNILPNFPEDDIYPVNPSPEATDPETETPELTDPDMPNPDTGNLPENENTSPNANQDLPGNTNPNGDTVDTDVQLTGSNADTSNFADTDLSDADLTEPANEPASF